MEVPRYWRQRKQRYSMVGEVCPNCKSHVFPPREVCPYCADANTKGRYSVAVEERTPIDLSATASAPSPRR